MYQESMNLSRGKKNDTDHDKDATVSDTYSLETTGFVSYSPDCIVIDNI